MMHDRTDDIDRRAEQRLADVDVDVALAKQMAQDARRVSAGALSREAFHERYREAVADEFDLEVPAYEDIDIKSQALGGFSQSRRSVLAALGAAGSATVATGASFEDAMARFGVGEETPPTAGADDDDRRVGMVIDTEACIKCLQCVKACKQENALQKGDFWMEVLRYQRADKEYAANDTAEDVESLPRPCMHCEDPPCVTVCPNNSRFVAEDGRVLCDYDACLGCRYCEVACPYHVNSLVTTDQPEGVEFVGQTEDEDGRWTAGPPPQGACSKCNFCAHRQVDPAASDGTQETTACAEACPVGAIQFGDRNDPDSDPESYLQERTDEDGVETFELRTDVTTPAVTYIGDSPEGVETVHVPGPTTHEDIGLEEPEDP